MVRKTILANIVTALILTTLTIASAMEIKMGDLTIIQPNIRATVPTAKVGAGYLTIRNEGSEAETLLGGTADFTGMVEVHEMKMNNGIMTMRPLSNGLVIPAGGEVVLKPGAEHLMFMQLKEPMTEGETRSVTLKFQNAGEIEIMFPVGSLGGSHSNHDENSHSGHGSSTTN
jgi:copper(I)-binding protein